MPVARKLRGLILVPMQAASARFWINVPDVHRRQRLAWTADLTAGQDGEERGIGLVREGPRPRLTQRVFKIVVAWQLRHFAALFVLFEDTAYGGSPEILEDTVFSACDLLFVEDAGRTVAFLPTER